MIQFGRDQNQVSHTFRHIDEIGLERVIVRFAILQFLEPVQSTLPLGLTVGSVEAKGVRLDFRAYKFIDGTINVGRINPG